MVDRKRGAHILLASASPRRRELLTLLGLPFETTSVAADETLQDGELPERVAARLARVKAMSAASRWPDKLVIGCDTVVALEGRPLGKPDGPEEATAMLVALRGRAHEVYTAVAVVGGGQTALEVAATTVWMRDYTDSEIASYVASGDPLDKAGAYAIQDPFFRPVERWAGCYANVVGLPLCHLTRALSRWGIVPKNDVPTACQTHTGKRCAVFRGILTQPGGENTKKRGSQGRTSLR